MGHESDVQVRPTFATPSAAAPQVLVRKSSSGRRRRLRYEVAYYPEGLSTAPLWVRLSKGLSVIPGWQHSTDLFDLTTLLTEAASEHDDRWIAWRVRYPAVVRVADLKLMTATDRRLLDTWRARQRHDPKAAGRVPLRVHRRGRRDNIVVGAIHELTAPGRTRCGLLNGLADLDGPFSGQDPQACLACACNSGC